ncbi:methyltransferase [Myxococcus vastator]|uniref:methyltransferase n=1 Tax=Myxococcus vastator TaxID=2709664 RepID=UPI0013D3AB89|nr:methyltransferase [Myxococcus vastator]
MNWTHLGVAPDGTHHITPSGAAAYSQRYDQVLKFHAPGLAPVSQGGHAWHIAPDGSAAYPQRFTRTFGFYEGLAAVVGLDGAHHITPDGRQAYAGRYAWCGNFQSGRCTVRDITGSYLHITTDGCPVYPERWCYAGDYRDGSAVVQAAGGRSTHIDLNGGAVHGRWYVDLDVFHKGYARARDDDGWTHVDMSGNPAYARRFAIVEPFYNGQARVERFDGALEVIDETGATIVEPRPPRRMEFAALSADMVGFWRTQTIAAAVRLGVIEALPATEAEVEDRCRLRPDGARRLLRALGELHLVTSGNERWELTPRGMFLRASHPRTLADAALEYAGPFSREWAALPDALRAESNWRAPDVFGEVARDRLRREGHHRMLQSYALHDYRQVPGALALRGDERIIDAGGGLGALGRLVAEAYPSVTVTVIDRPEVVAQGQYGHPPRRGVAWRAADIFQPWGLKADGVLLSRVLHDWEDDDARRLLAHARAALPLGGRVFVIEMMLPSAGVAGALCDLHLLMTTGGRERSVDEYERLLNATGFQLQAVRTIAALPTILVGVAS